MEDESPENESAKVRHTAAEWRAIVADYRSRGISPRSYSELTGVSYSQLLYWRTKYGDGGTLNTSTSSGKAGVVGFKELQVISGPREYRIELSNNLRLSFPSGSDIKEIAALAKLLAGGE